MNHYPTIAHIPGSATGRLITDKPVRKPDNVVRERFVEIEMAELSVEVLILIISDTKDAILDPKGVFVVVVQWLTRNFDVPATKVFSIEQLNPFLSIGVSLGESRRYKA
jgi:hypothetical protein